MNDDDRAWLPKTQASWNEATKAHNAHKRDQAAFFRAGGSTLYAEEQALMARALGVESDGLRDALRGQRLLHVLCNSGQDTLSWARLGADVTGVDLSDEAVAFARALSADSGIAGRFVHSEAQTYLHDSVDDGAFDVVFGSYGCLPWIAELPHFFAGIARKLRPGGVVVVVEFHPLVWSFGPGFALRDPYFSEGRRYDEPVGDYVAQASGALSPSGHVETEPFVNPHAARSYQHTVADQLSAALSAGLVLEHVAEWPFANGCRCCPDLVDDGQGRFVMPAGLPSLPLMVGFIAQKP
jgi:SAM-dependent methyltransferase